MKIILTIIQASDIILVVFNILKIIYKISNRRTAEMEEFKIENDKIDEKGTSKIRSCVRKFMCVFSISTTSIVFILIMYKLNY